MSNIIARKVYENGDELVARTCHSEFWNHEKGKLDIFDGFEVMFLEEDIFDGERCHFCVCSEYFLDKEEALKAYNIRLTGTPTQHSSTFPKTIVELVS